MNARIARSTDTLISVNKCLDSAYMNQIPITCKYFSSAIKGKLVQKLTPFLIECNAFENVCLLVVRVGDDFFSVENGEYGEKQTAILVVCHSASVVTLSCQVGESREGKLIVVIQEHLQIVKRVQFY